MMTHSGGQYLVSSTGLIAGPLPTTSIVVRQVAVSAPTQPKVMFVLDV